nr:MAG TPA: PVL ORF-50-like family [Caudoviricetes sp.]
MSEWCEILGLKDRTVRSRLNYGWSIEQAFELEVKTND